MGPDKTALVLEGGGLRGVFTSGVLRFFMEQELWFPSVYGVSMGACNGANYVSRQTARNRIVNIRYANDSRYFSYAGLFLRGELFGMRFLFDRIPNRMVPFDFKTFRENDQEYFVAATDCETGEAVYFDKHRPRRELLTVMQASCSMPFLARPVRYQGRVLLDGGIADSVPLFKSIRDGANRQVLILTQPTGYRKKGSRMAASAFLRYPRYKGLCRAIATRAERYNAVMDAVVSMEAQGRVFAIRPESKLIVGRVERDRKKLYAVYDQGYLAARRSFDELSRFIHASGRCL